MESERRSCGRESLDAIRLEMEEASEVVEELVEVVLIVVEIGSLLYPPAVEEEVGDGSAGHMASAKSSASAPSGTV